MNKKLMLIPIAILLLSILVIVNNIITTGSFMKRDVELTGGLKISIPTKERVNINEIQKALPDSSVQLATGYDTNILIIQTQDLDEKNVIKIIKNFVEFNESDIETGTIEPVLGEVFWKQARVAIIIAFLLIGIVVFIAFRAIIPSFAVIFSTLSDIITIIAVLSLLGVRLSLPIFAGLLMIIGYSIDTDVLLATRMLKRSGEVNEKIYSAIKTGTMMTLTSLAAVISLYVFSGGTIIQEIALVLIIGLSIDMVNTWIMDACLFDLWLKRRVK